LATPQARSPVRLAQLSQPVEHVDDFRAWNLATSAVPWLTTLLQSNIGGVGERRLIQLKGA